MYAFFIIKDIHFSVNISFPIEHYWKYQVFFLLFDLSMW